VHYACSEIGRYSSGNIFPLCTQWLPLLHTYRKLADLNHIHHRLGQQQLGAFWASLAQLSLQIYEPALLSFDTFLCKLERFRQHRRVA
jgi:hypothetical protein